MTFDLTLNIEIIFAMIVGLFSAYIWVYKSNKTNLQQSLHRKKHIALLENSSFEKKYKTTLASTLSWISNLYDNKTWIQNYSRHVTIALIYAFVIFLLFWLLDSTGENGKIGEVIILENLTDQKKFLAFTFWILFIAMSYLAYNHLRKLITYLITKLPNNLQNSQIAKLIITILVGVGVVVGIGIGIAVAAVVVGEVGENVGVIVIVGVGVLIIIAIVVEREAKNIKNIFKYLFTIFIIWLIIFLFSQPIKDAALMSLILASITFPMILTIKKIGFGINLIILGVILLFIISMQSNTKDDQLYVVALFM